MRRFTKTPATGGTVIAVAAMLVAAMLDTAMLVAAGAWAAVPSSRQPHATRSIALPRATLASVPEQWNAPFAGRWLHAPALYACNNGSPDDTSAAAPVGQGWG